MSTSAGKTTVGESMNDLLSEIAKLPGEWHGAGSVSMPVLHGIVRHSANHSMIHSAETGSGKTSLLFSHLSQHHKVFAKEEGNRSVTLVRQSPLCNAGAVEFIEGATQRTLPQYRFTHRLQVVLIDGPHGYPFPELEYFYLYPQLDEGALLIVDDIHIPTIRRLFEFLNEDAMFRTLEIVDTTAFLQRTNAPLFDPEGDGWWLQQYNTRRFPVHDMGFAARWRQRVGRFVPRPIKSWLKLSRVSTSC